MKISKKAYYGLRAMVALARYFPATLSVRALASQEKLPEEYLEKILQKLRRAKLIEANKGQHGGYRLVHSPENISIDVILATLDGDFVPFTCAANKKDSVTCPIQEARAAQDVWSKVSEALTRALQSLSLRDLK
jgi:Rrf2 family protein